MTAVPFELPLKASEASALADLVFQHAEGRNLTEDVRNRIAVRAAMLNLSSIRACIGSLEQDPVHTSTYYVAVDALSGPAPVPLLLHMAPASAPFSALFPKPLLIGRMRPGGGREIVINAIPFSSRDHEHIDAFVSRLNQAFLPRPQGAQPAIAAGNRHPEISLPAVFDAYRTILKNTGVNLASTVQLSASHEMCTEAALAERTGDDPMAPGHTRVSIGHLYHAGLWAAIRQGWREGYTAEADRIDVSGVTEEEVRRSLETAKALIAEAAGFTKFTAGASRLFRPRADSRRSDAWTEGQVRERFEADFTAEERAWLHDEFSRTFQAGERSYALNEPEVTRLAVKFGPALKAYEELFGAIRQARAASGGSRLFDFEVALDETETLTTPEELIFCLHWLRARGAQAQLVAPNIGFRERQAYPTAVETSREEGVGCREYARGEIWPELLPRVVSDFGSRPLDELASRVAEFASVARHFNAVLSIHSGSGKQAPVLEQIGKATAGRANYKISGELQLQLFDVLREQSHESPWRRLFDRMVRRAESLAESGAFDEGGELAARCREAGRGTSLGDARRGRADGNLFLILWLGNVVGCRDIHSPDGDTRFFKDKLDELPENLLREVRERNSDYVVWLASHLRS